MLATSLRSIYCATLSTRGKCSTVCVVELAHVLTYVCQCVLAGWVGAEGAGAACTHINILQAMGVILGIFIFAGNAKRQPTSNLALSYFL